jgi:tRNA nucleotidyltransferase (CCA-adding enzyme)
MKIYQVGGAIRDRLLRQSVKDRDWVVVGSTPDEMTALGYKPVGKDFPVFLHPVSHEEYALARTERKAGKGYKGFIFHTSPDISIEDDLARRDLTINAIAEDEAGNLIDPFAGKKDLEQGILRHVSRAFTEDPLRVLRVARFAARLGFKVAEETMQLMRAIGTSGELETLTAERVWSETDRALSEKYPTRYILVLRACNALKILFPEIDCLFGVPQPEKHHPEIDTGMHTIMVLNQAARLTDDTQVRFAALVHDLGKGTTRKNNWPRHIGHETRGVRLVDKFCRRYRIPNAYRELAKLVTRYHLDCHRVMQLRPETILKKLETLDAFRRPERFEQFLIACEADARGRTGYEDSMYPQAEYFRNALNLAKNIDTTTFQEQELNGEAMAKSIRQLRLSKLKELT